MSVQFWDSIKPMLGTLVSGEGTVSSSSMTSREPETASTHWQAGDWVVYRKSKRSKNPGRRAAQIHATQKGETYAYVVDKFWIVEEVIDDRRLLVRTPGGKQNIVDADDPNLMKAGLLARIRWGQRFRRIEREYARSTFAA